MSNPPLVKEILVNVGERETRIAVLEDSRLVELYIERAERVVGSIYKCRVVNVLPGMDAAFVDIGLERNAFLYVGDVMPSSEDVSGADTGERISLGRARRDANAIASTTGPVERASLPVDMELQKEAADAIAEMVEEPAELLEEGDEEAEEVAATGTTPVGPHPRSRFKRSTLRQQRIKDVLHVGQELIVQVIKGPRGTKGARVSTRVSLPGRYLVLMPETDQLGVSRKIEDAKERDRLKKIGDAIRQPGFGLIIRTEAEDKTEQELAADMEFLIQTWRQTLQQARLSRPPALILQDLTLLYKTIRDVFGSDVQKLMIDDPAEYFKANQLLERISPKLIGRIQLYDEPQPIFDYYKIEDEIERLMRRKVFLKSGGSLVIDETEALTVIDVNTSKSVGGNSLAETIVRTNLEAAVEVARQMRLRDIGGIIVIDFIDMNNQRDKQAVIKALETALKRDRSRTKISSISALGLVEMTRKRTGETLNAFLTEECPYCKGRGHLSSPESVSLFIERDLRRIVLDNRSGRREAFSICCHPDVAELLIGPEGCNIEELERLLQRALFVRADESMHLEKYVIDPCEIQEMERLRQAVKRLQVVECRVTRSLLKDSGQCVGWVDGFLVDVEASPRHVGQKLRARIMSSRRSYTTAQILSEPGKGKQ